MRVFSRFAAVRSLSHGLLLAGTAALATGCAAPASGAWSGKVTCTQGDDHIGIVTAVFDEVDQELSGEMYIQWPVSIVVSSVEVHLHGRLDDGEVDKNGTYKADVIVPDHVNFRFELDRDDEKPNEKLVGTLHTVNSDKEDTRDCELELTRAP